jgi:hypothetical protein
MFLDLALIKQPHGRKFRAMRLLAPLVFLILLSKTVTWAEEPLSTEVTPVPLEAPIPDSSPKAVPAPTEPSDTKTDAPLPRLPGMRFIDVGHGFFSRSLESMTDHVDTFFGDDRIFIEDSGTYTRLSGSAIYEKKGELTFDGTVRLRLDLQNLSRLGRKVNLILASDDDAPDGGKITTGEPIFDRIDSAKPVAALQIVLQEKRRWDVRLQPGLKMRVPLDPFIKLRTRRLQPLGEDWLLRLTTIPAWYESRGLELKSVLDFDTTPSERSLLRLSNGLFWEEGSKKNVQLQPSVSYSYILTPADIIAATTGVIFDTTPYLRDTTYFANIRYRRNLHEKWIFVEIKPQIVFERNASFRPDPSLILTVDMLFGEQYR